VTVSIIPSSGRGSGRIALAGLTCFRPGRRSRRDWLHVIRLPVYTPDLNPPEAVWSHLKRSIGNLAVHGVDHLQTIIKNQLTAAAIAVAEPALAYGPSSCSASTCSLSNWSNTSGIYFEMPRLTGVTMLC
jgi:hypothetical protein